jgi:ATP adenylyltransferase/5',5'''-P-1,P-4-tetraphosphate phosphorylase II
VASSPQSFNKRQRERAKKEKAAAKRARRHARDDGDEDVADDTPDEDALLERFRLLNEQHAAGTVTTEEFEEQRKEIFELLGLGED